MKQFDNWTQRVCRVFAALLVLAALPGGLWAQEAPGLVTAEPATPPSPVAAEGQTSEPTATPESTEPGQEVDMAKAVQINQVDGTITLQMNDVDLKLVLLQLSEIGRQNVITSPNVQGKVTADLKNVTFAEALQAILRSQNMVAVEKGKFIYVYTQEEYDTMQRRIDTRVFHFKYIRASNAKDLVSGMLTKDGKVSASQTLNTTLAEPNASEKLLTNNPFDLLVVSDTIENLKKIEKMISEIDRRPDQVLVESTILSVLLNDDEDMGVDWQVIAGNGSMNFANATRPLPDPFSGNVQYQELDRPAVGGGTSGFTASSESFPAGGFSFGVVTSNISMFLRALERVRDISVMANPKLLLVNKMRGEVLVGNERGYIASTTQTETSLTQEVQFLKTGTKLIFRPFVGRDGFVRMEIHPEISNGDVSVPLNSTVALPNKTTTEVTTNIMARDGATIVIGGLFQEQTTRDRSQTPIAGDMPWGIGNLFRNTNDNFQRRELIALITPHIVTYTKEEKLGAEMLKMAERYRIGAREGMTFWSRVRSSDWAMSQARKAAMEGNVEKALWMVDLTLAASPQKHDAQRLRDRLRPMASWAVEPMESRTQYLIHRLIAADEKLPAPTPRAPEFRPQAPVTAIPEQTTTVIEQPAMPEPPKAPETPLATPEVKAPATPEAPVIKEQPKLEAPKVEQPAKPAVPAATEAPKPETTTPAEAPQGPATETPKATTEAPKASPKPSKPLSEVLEESLKQVEKEKEATTSQPPVSEDKQDESVSLQDEADASNPDKPAIPWAQLLKD